MYALLKHLHPNELYQQFRIHLQKSNSSTFLILAALVGLGTAVCVRLFHIFIDLFHELFTKFIATELLGPILGAAAFIVTLTLAGWLVGLWMERFVGEERLHGVAAIIEAVTFAGGRLPFRKAPFKTLASSLSLGAGASLGPEAPSVEIGANVGSWFGQRLHLSEEHIRVLVAAGAASGISAAFQAPIAGVFFALEVILNASYEMASVGVIVLASVMATALTQAFEPHRDMGPFTYTLGSPFEVPLFVPLGVLLALVAIFYIRTVFWQHDLWHSLHLRRPYKTALAGFLVGVVAVFLPQIMGAGRETMNAVLDGSSGFGVSMLLALGVFKMLTYAVSSAGGFVGGIFAPALFVGTMFGGIYGQLISGVLHSGTDPQAYAIAGMAGMLAGIIRSPITAIMMVFELTNDYRLILPIMLTTVVCVYLAERVEPDSVDKKSLHRAGIHLQQGRDIDLMQGIAVEEVMLKPPPSISHRASLSELRDALREKKSLSLVVLDGDGLLVGIVTLSDLQRAYEDETSQDATVGDICTREVITSYPDEALWEVIRRMSVKDVGRLPVIKRGTREVVGLIGRHGVVRAYNLAISRKLKHQHDAERIRLNTLTGGHVFEVFIHEGASVVGKHIHEVHWPAESVVASIHRKAKLIIPHGDTDLKVGDVLTIVADPEAEAELHELVSG
jgi:CIC family chloride channel protein